MATIGKIGEFSESRESFTCYIERLGQYFEANEIADGKKVPILLTVVGPEAYGLLKHLLSPELPSTRTYGQLVDVLTNYYTPAPLVIAESAKFHRRNQKEGETISGYLMELKKLAVNCEFGDSLTRALRDRFVGGLRNEATQKKLLTVPNLTLEHAVEIAQAVEMADRNTQEIGLNVKAASREHSVQVISKASNGKGSYSFGQRMKTASKKQIPCFRCGGNHSPQSCRFKNEECFACSKKGHTAKMCHSRKKQSKIVATKYVAEEPELEELGLYTVYTSAATGSAYKVQMEVAGEAIVMEVDTGAAVSIIPEKLYTAKYGHIPLEKAPVRLKTYSGEYLPLIGQFHAKVKYEQQESTLPIIVVKGDNPVLLGRNWLEKLKLNWKNIFSISVSEDTVIDGLVRQYPTVFQDGFGTIKEFKAEIRLQAGTQPIYCKARPVPYALREAVENELDRLEKNGIVTKVDHSKWATPIVVVPKADKTIRICGDYKVTVNRCIEVQKYPLPNAEDIFATLAGGTVFSKLDLTSAYQQLELDEQSKELLTINTHRGLYRFNRLAFGVSSAPAIFQSVLEQILQGLDQVKCRLDDILISTATQVLQRLEQYGVRLKLSKCVFMKPSVTYLGHLVDSDGIHPLADKVAAIENAPAPTNVNELKSFLGLINYYGKFITDLSTTLQPMHELLKKKCDMEMVQIMSRGISRM